MPAASKITIDFTGVEIRRGGSSDHVPEGDYLAHVERIENTTVKNDPSRKMLKWLFILDEPVKFKGKKVYHNTLLESENLWSLRSLLVDLMGEDRIPASKLNIPLDVIQSKKLKVGLTLEDNEYNNKIKSQINSTFPKAQWAERQASATSDDIDEDDAESPDTVTEATTSSTDDEDMDEIDVDDI